MDLCDRNWRLENLYSIVDKDGNTIPFERNNIQRAIAKDPSQRKMILKARQFGVSTGCIAELCDDAFFTRNINCCILAHEQDSIKKLFQIVQRFYRFLPEEIKPRLDRGGGSRYEMFFPDINSRIFCDLESRGNTINRLHVSEAAFMKDSSKLKSTLQAVPLRTGRVTIETTANGVANHFYDMWTDTESIYKKLFFPWYMFPAYTMPTFEKIIHTEEELKFIKKAKKLYGVQITDGQIAFRRFKKAELKESSHDKVRVTFDQEYPEDDQTCFLASGQAAFDLVKINSLMQNLSNPLSEKHGIKIYRKHEKHKRYVLAADPAEGVNSDFSVGVMIDIEEMEVVAVLRGQFKPSDFAGRLNSFAKMYLSPGPIYPILAVERNNHGHAVLLALDEIHHYPNLYVSDRDEKLGWKTDQITRPLMIDQFIQAVEAKHLKVNDKIILGECLTLVDNDGKIEAASGKHDDTITATAIGLQVCLRNSSRVYDDIEDRILV